MKVHENQIEMESPVKTFQEWMLTDPRLILKPGARVFYVGPDCVASNDYHKTSHTDHFTVSCDAIFISCRTDVCHEFVSRTALPMSMLHQALLFHCTSEHLLETDPCTFGEVNTVERSRELYYNSLDHDEGECESECIPLTSMLISRVTAIDNLD